ncbi:MAG TPA: TIGR03618 family F420-dependent PPOX class oxidoreductase [Gaiellaceae bacterium]
MRKDLQPDELGDLLDQPLVAVLATYRRDGSVLLSPVWHRWRGGGFDVVTNRGGIKERHLQHDPRASVLVYEHAPPYRGIEVSGEARLEPSRDAFRDIAIRYLGEEAGAAYAEQVHDETLIRLEPGHVRAWDFADDFG